MTELPVSIAKLNDHDQSRRLFPGRLQTTRIQTVIQKAKQEILLRLALWSWLHVMQQRLQLELPMEHWNHVWLEYLEGKTYLAGMLEHLRCYLQATALDQAIAV